MKFKKSEMKMEILAVQNEFMHVMPSKTKDGDNTLLWTTSHHGSVVAAQKKSQSVSVAASVMKSTQSPKHSHYHHHHHHHNHHSSTRSHHTNSYNNNNSNSNMQYERGMAAFEEQLLEEEEDDSFLTTLPHWNESEIEHVRNVLMATLRDAKQRHLAATEVLLPRDLLERIAIDMLSASDEEACGIRGANIRIEFDNGDGSGCNEIATCNTDLNTVATFELRLTLKQEHSRGKWISAIMPQFIRNLTRASTIVISSDYTLSKHKLNYSFAE